MSSKMVLGSNIENIYSLTPVQEGMLYHKLMNSDSSAYIVQHLFEMNGLINEQKVEDAIQLVAMKHEVLRTSIVYEKLTIPRQIILKNRTIEYERIDLSNIAVHDLNNKMDTIAQLDVDRGFDLQRDSLLRVKLVYMGLNQYKMLWTFHHIIIDGWSLSILFSDFKTYYDMLDRGRSLQSIMSIVEVDKKSNEKYGDYVKWLEQQNVDEGITYWDSLLSDYDGATDIKSMEQLPLAMETVSLSTMKLSKEQTARLQNLAATHHTTMNTMVETAWGMLLQLYTGAKDVVYGKVISGRHVAIRGIEKIVGPFIITIPARISCKRDDMIAEVLRSVQLQGTKSTAYSYCPLQKIMSLTKQKSDLIKYLYAYENYELDENLLTQHNDGLGLKIETYREQTNYDLALIVSNEDGYLRFQMQYAPNHYGSREIEAMLLRLQAILLSFDDKPEMKVSELETITEAEKERILGEFNDTYLPYAKDETIPALWEEQVAHTPDAIAVVYEDNYVTYDALNRKINQVAWALRSLHIQPDDRVVIVAERSVEMIAGIYGIIKAGGAYVPVDPTLPAERMRFILNDCNPKAVLVYQTTIETDLPTIDLAGNKLQGGESDNPEAVNRPDDLAYIIYTSGTTGQPKGVMLAHRGVVAMRSYLQEKYKVTSQDNVLQFANYIFDASVWEMTLSLLLGARLTLVSQSVLSDVNSFNTFVQKNGITLTLLPPQYYLQTEINGLRVLTTGGSAANAEMIEKAGSGTRYINAYGPTESTVLATGWEYDGESDIPSPVPIGKPTSNTQIYMMDGMKLCGIGVPGELCIAGSGVAKGYLNLPELTAEKFIENPYGEGKLYRTGDLAQWLPDGNIAYLGRIDDQVKIRGFRIEPGEVENALRQLEGIQDAAVIVRENQEGEKALHAYLISKDPVQLQALRRDLEDVLPAYMVPAYMMQIDQLPVTRNGKLDKRALPEIVAVSEKAYTAPKNELEAQLCQIFSEVLGVERVGTQDSFFELGGDSIKAIRIVSKLRSAGYDIAIKDIMQRYTVEAISYAAQKSVLEEQYEQEEVSGLVPLTPIVREFASWNLPKPHHFNQDMLMEIELEEEQQLREVLDALTAHHDILRSVYREGQLEITKVSDSKAYELRVFNYNSIEIEEREVAAFMNAACTELHSSINLEEGPLVKAAMFRTREGNLLFLGIHHLVVDGVSWRILQEDISTAIQQVKDGKQIRFPAKTASYKAWAEALAEYKDSPLLQKERAYWEQVATQMATSELGMDEQTGESGYDSCTIHLNEEETEQLIHQAGRAYHTEINDLLISALGMAVQKLTGARDVTIGMEGHGREAIHKRIDIDRTVGWFTSMYPVVVPCHEDIAESIITTKEMLRKIPNRGLGYGLLQDELAVGPLEVMFNYMGQMDAEAKGKTLRFFSSGKGSADENTVFRKMIVNGGILDGKLQLVMGYNRSYLSRERMESFSERYQAALLAVKDHCIAIKETVRTPSDYRAASLTRTDLSVIQEAVGGSSQVERIYGLTSLQKGMLYHSIAEPESTAYRNQNVFVGQGYADEHLVKEALKLLALRHEVLRTAIIHKEISMPHQVVIREREVEYTRTDLTGAEASVQAERVEAIAHGQIRRGFELAQDPLLRVHHVVLSQDRYQLIWNFHHMIMDGWSLSAVYGDFNRLYQALQQGALPSELTQQIMKDKQDHASYEDYLAWLEQQDQDQGLSYWSDVLAGYEEVAEIKPVYPVEASEQQVERLAITLTPEDQLRIKELTSAHQVTVSNVVETAWGVVLQAYSGQKDVVFGKVTSGRQSDVRGIEDIVGLFINTIPVRVASQEGMHVIELLKEMQQQGSESEQYAYCSLSEIQSQTKQKQHLIQVLYAFENYYVDEKKLTNFTYKIGSGRDQNQYNLTLCVYESGEKIVCEMLYNPNVYASEDIVHMLARLEHVLHALAVNPEMKLSELETTTEEEKEQILGAFQTKPTQYPREESITSLFEAQVKKTPDRIAVSCGTEQLTYAELNAKANIVANRLLASNGGCDTGRGGADRSEKKVALLLERNIDMVIGILGVVKAGYVYVPIDPEAPQDRIQYMLMDSGASLLLVNQGKEYRASLPQGNIYAIEPLYADIADRTRLEANPDVSIAPQDALYIIYTSGTTGEPKGTVIEHECVVRLMHNDDMPFEFHEEDVWSLFAAYNFDVSVWEMYGALLYGGHLVVIPNDAKKDSYAFLEILREKRVTVLNQVPSSFYNLMQVELAEAGERLYVNHLIFAGEALQVGKLKAWHAKYPEMNIVNMYGITETTVHVTYKAITAADIELDINDVGKALPTLKIYMLDGDKLCGIGVPGELCVAGVGVARGYLNKPELTNKKFVDNPFVPGERMYRSGDLAQWLPDGNIAYLGRIDDQVKIRGFRIEPGEVEHALRQLEGIQDAAVIVRENQEGEKALHAYLISKDPVQLQALRRDLEDVLPAYMVPAYMMQIDQLPVTRNGKLDKRALPEIVAVSEKAYTAPKNELEAQLCQIFSEVLGVERVGTQDSFFELGGDSIKAIRIVSKLRSAGYDIAIKDIMQRYTVEAISYAAQKSVLEEQYEQEEVSGLVPLTPIVREFASWNLPKPHHFNQDMLMEIELEEEQQLREVLDALTAHHDILRSVYREGQLEITKVSDSKAYELKVFNYNSIEIEEREVAAFMNAACTELHSSINLEEGPLVKAAMFRTREGNLLFLGIHHLVVDGVSWRILQEDISTAIQQVKDGKQIRFPAKTASYKAWAEALAEYKDSPLLQKERAYWEQVATQMATSELGMDEQTGESGYDSCTIHLNEEETEQLIHQAGRAYHTEINDLLISALGMAVQKLTGARDVTIGMEGHGREAIHKRIDIDRTVGWFTSVYPVVVPCHEDIAESIITTKEMLRKIPNRGLGYGLLQDELAVGPLEVMFNYMGQMDAEAKGKTLRFFSSGKGSADENTVFRKMIVNGGILDGKLQLVMGYNRSYLSRERMESFSERYQAALLAVKDHCIAIKETVRTPSDYRAASLTRTDLSVIQEAVGGSSQVERIYGLTSLQKGMLYHSIAEPESTAYRNQNVFVGQGYADEHLVKEALKLLALRHEVLRTAIIHKEISMPHQVVIREREVEYTRTDLTGAEASVQAERVEAIAHGQIRRGFELAQDPLLRVHHVVLSQDRYQLIWNFHHMIMDGWCLSVVYGDFNRLYQALQQGALPSELTQQIMKDKQDHASYEDYLAWLEQQDQDQGLSYWSDVLAGYEEVAEIKPVYPVEASEQQVERLAITLTPEDRLRIKELTSAHQMTVSNVVETAWGVVLQAYSGQKDVVFGKVTSGRQSDVRGIEDIVGLFINTIPVRVASQEGMHVIELLKEMQQQGSESEQYAYCSLSEIQSQTKQKQHLIQVLYAFENYYVDEKKLTNFTYKITSSRDQPPYNLTLCAYESGEKIVCEMLYNPNVYASEDIVHMLARLEHVLHALAVNPEMKVSELETITEEEKERILGEFNDTYLPYAKDETIPALWEEQVAHTPDAIAVVYEDNYVTYDALNRKINQVAWALRSLHIQPDDRVVIVAERSVEMIAGIYGIIKAGGAYVPVDPTLPAERMRFILNDCNPKAVLVYQTTIETDLPTIDLADNKLQGGESDNPEAVNRPDDLAYIIYTSGTTGQPKGVMLAHRGVVAMRSYLQEKYKVTSQDNVLQFANYIFDASVWEMTLSLLLGARLTLVSQSVLSDVNSFNTFVQKNGITLTLLPPQYYLQTEINGLRVLTTGGSAANAEMIEKAGSGTRYINAYGPTESTVLATGWEYDGESDIPSPVPIGKPTSNTQIYMMDGMKLCGIGVPGELCIAGSGVAKGYLNLPELTAEKFIENPYGEGKLYRTGDLAQWLPDGNIAYLGRIDDQVKIRGFRIEPGEVENALRQLEGIQDAAVIVRENQEGEKALHAYLISKDPVQLQALRRDLEDVLPAYMVPAYMMQIDQLPVTRNGKLDKRALPEIVAVSEKAYTAPKNELEAQLCQIFSEVLGVERVGTQDSFFELGGDSIKAIRIVSKLRSAGYDIAIKDIMQRYTVEAISYAAQKSVLEEQYEQEEVSGLVPLTPIVREFASWNLPKPHHFNQDMLMEIELEEEQQLREVLDALTAHHDILRSVYREGQLEITKVSDSKAYELKVFNYNSIEIEEREVAAFMNAACTELHSSINLEEGPLVKAAMFRTREGNLLFLGIHHLVVDGVSWRILQEDISTAIQQVKDGKQIRFPAKTASYKAWAEALAEYKDSPLLQKERVYWEQVATQMATSELGMDEQTGESGYDSCTIHLNEEETEQLIHQAGRAYHTEINDLLISALGMAVQKLTGARDVTIGMEGHGREAIHKRIDIDRTVGWFTSMYPVVVPCHEDIAESIITTKEMLRKIPNRGLGYGLLQDELAVGPLEVMFNYMGQMDAEAKGKTLRFFSSGKGSADENTVFRKMIVNGGILDGKLQLVMGYNRSYLSRERMESFSERYQAALLAVKDHCITIKETVRTPSDYRAASLTRTDLSVIQEAVGGSSQVERIYGLTSLQKGMLYHSIAEPESTAYRNQNVFVGQGYADEHLVKEALKLLALRHEVLRTAIIHKEISMPHQVVIREREVEYTRTDLTGAEASVQAERVEAIAHGQIRRGFELAQDPLLRVHHVVLSQDRYQLIWNFHHMIMDGWSLSAVYGDFNRLYQALQQGALPSELTQQIMKDKQDHASYEDYLAWLEQQDQDQGLSYWSDVLAGYEEVAEIKPVYPVEASEQQVERLAITLTPEDRLRIKELTSAHQMTVSNVVETAWGVVLQAYSGQKDVVFGKVTSGRQSDVRGIEDIVGLFINTIPVRVASQEGMHVIELLKEMQQQGSESEQYAYCSLSEIQSQTKQKQHLIQVLYAFENYYVDEKKLTNFTYKIGSGRDQNQYNLTLCVYESGEKIVCEMLYNPNVYASEDIVHMLARLEHVLHALAVNPEMKLSELETTTEEEKEQILGAFQTKPTQYPREESITSLFEAQVKKTPDRIAVSCGTEQLTYAELNAKANIVANRLLASKAESETSKGEKKVALLLERNIDMVIGILGVVKAGYVYVPIDPEAPQDRIQYMLMDSGASLLLVNQGKEYRASLPQGNIYAIEPLYADIADRTRLEANPDVSIAPQDALYIIYTSGTTGEPKGTVIEHECVVRLMHNDDMPFEFHEEDVWSLFAAYNFDVSVWEMYGALLYGGHLVVIPNDAKKDSYAFLEILREKRVTVLNQVPSSFYNLMQVELAEAGERLYVNHLIFAGEALQVGKLKAWHAKYPEMNIVNMYGITETTVHVTYKAITAADIELDINDVGKALPTLKIYMLDGDKLCGIGVPGELCVAGVGVARGYLNKPELTNKKFVDNPFVPGERMYRSGDLAQWLPDGNIAYLGRIDDQVKIRGFRIEPGEVENALRQLEGIQDAAVIVRENQEGEKALHAYLISKDPVQLQALRRDLEDVLPAYMVPAYMMQIDQLPVTRNGKLDKRALPEIVAVSEKAYTAPKNELEAQLCQIFSEVLGVERVGTQDSFFELGGDSIKAIRIVSKLRSAGYDIAIKDIMQRYTVEAISYAAQKSVLEEQYEQEEVSGLVPLTPIVREFASWNLPKPHHFNQDMLMEIELEEEQQLREVLDALTAHHDILRSVYREGQLEITKVSDSKAYELKVFNYNSIEIEEREVAAFMNAACTELHSSINLEEGPLVKAAMFRTREGNLLFLGIHHLVVDGVSWRILQEDISTAIQQVKDGKQIRFPAKTASYKAWAEALAGYKDSPLLQKERVYWEQVATQMATSELGMDEQTGESGYDSCTIHLNEEDTEQLIHQAGRAYHTEINDLLISALGMAVQKLTGARDVTIGMEGHGREAIHKRIDIDRTVGWFTSVYPVVVPCHEDIAESIITTKEMLRKIPNRGLGYGLLQDELAVGPLEVMFNYMGQMDAEAKGKTLRFFSSGKGSADENTVFRKMIVNGGILDGKLQLVMGYNRSYLSRERMESFSERYQAALLAVKDHCIAIKETVRTPSDYRAASLTRTDLSVIQEAVGGSSQVERIYGLTSLQKGMLYHSIAEPESTAYRNQNVFVGQGYADEHLVKEALKLLALRHEVLRTAIIHKEISMPHQVVIREREVEYTRTDLTGAEASVQAERVEAIAHGQIRRGFELAQDPLLRVHHVVLSQDRYQLIWNFHHMIMDGWCLSVVYGDFNRLYQALQQGALPSELTQQIMKDKQDHASYEDYLAWLEQQDQDQGLSYWSDVLAGYEEVAEIKPVYPVEASEQQVERLAITLTPEDRLRIKELTSAHQMTVSNVVETAWGVVLQAYSGQKDVVFGKVTSGRQSDVRGIEDIVGLFINTIPVRVASQEGMHVIELLKEMQQQGSESEQYAYCSLSEIQSQTKQKQHLIQVLYAFENYYVDEKKLTNFTYKITSSRDQPPYNLTLCAYESGEKIVCEMLYNPNVYASEDIVHMLARLEHVLHALAVNPEMKVSELETITEEEKERILGEFNDTYLPYAKDETIPALWEEQVAHTPDAIAVVYEDNYVTYDALNRKINQVAWALRSLHIQPDDRVVIVAERSVEMIAGIYGIIKAGGAYVPVDPTLPAERMRFILNDCNPKAVLVYQTTIETDLPTIDLADNKLQGGESDNPEAVNRPDDLAYIIYTSGTTGQPKGVMLAHRGVVAMRSYLQEKYKVTSQDNVLQFANYIFDASVWEMTLSLLLGARLTLVSQSVLSDVNSFNTFVQKNGITLTLLPPQYYLQTEINGLRVLTTGGSAANAEMIEKAGSGTRYINAYGPTESTVLATGWEYDGESDIPSPVPIGKPTSNTQIYMMDGMKLCGIGVPGELCIAGSGVAKGYLNLPELTAEKFIENPYGEGKLYRTGDLAQWLPDGNIAYLGRIDDQVKIRGFRIELGEVEHALRQLEGIQDAVVVATNNHEIQSLCGYIVSSTVVDPFEIKQNLKKFLPSYMIPSFIMQMEQIPVTRSGKVDKQRLPSPNVRALVEQDKFVAAQNDREKELVTIWRDILKSEQIGIYDNFFEIGGNSLLIMSMLVRIEEMYPGIVNVGDIFANPTIAQLAPFIDVSSQTALRCAQVPFPDSYLLGSKNKEFVFHFQDNSDLFHVLKGMQIESETALESWLLFLYTYSVIEATGQQELSVCYGANNTFSSFKICNHDDLNVLLENINSNKQVAPKCTQAKFKIDYKQNGLFPIFLYQFTGNKGYTEYCDFSFSFTMNEEAVYFEAKILNRTLNSDFIQSLFLRWIQIVQHVSLKDKDNTKS